MSPRCDCTARCGDDRRIAAGLVVPCDRWTSWNRRARIVDVQRDGFESRTLRVVYDREPTADDLRELLRHDRWPHP